LSDGGRGYDYGVGTINVPPPTFDAATASTAELRLYGFPHRPAGGAPLTAWLEQVGHARFRSPGPFLVARSDSQVSPLTITQATSQRWAGYIAQTRTTYTNANWVEEKTPSTQPCINPYLTVWTGVGGYSQPNFINQAGTQPDKPGTTIDDGWYENRQISASAVFVPRQVFYAVPGTNTDVTVQVAQHSYGTYFTYFWSNVGSGLATSNTSPLVNNNQVDLTTGEFILERPEVNQVIQPLMQFDSPLIWNHAWVNNEGTGVGFYRSVVQITVENPTTHVLLANPGSLYNNGQQFNTHYNTCN